MTQDAPEAQNDLDDVRARFPGWNIRAHPRGDLWATRLEIDLTNRQREAGLAMTVVADSLDQLHTELAKQAQISSWAGPKPPDGAGP